MPAMPRVKGKATKIAYKILGVPNNMKDSEKARDKKVDEKLFVEETVRMR